MEPSEIIAIIAGVVAVVVAGLAYWRSGQPMTVTGLTETLADAQTLAGELREVAEIAVLSAEQLKENGDIKTNEQAFKHAFRHVQKWYEQFGGTQQLDPELITNTVEGVYHAVKTARAGFAQQL